MTRSVQALLVCLLSTAGAGAQSYPAAWNLAHPAAKALVGVDVRNLRESQIGQTWGNQINQSSFGMLRLPGMEFLNEIDQVLISSPGGKLPNGKNPPFLVVLTGHFTAGHLQQFFHGPRRTYRGVGMYGPSATGSMTTAALDERTVVFGDEASLRGAIDRSSQAGNPQGALLARAAAMAAIDDFWLIATLPPSAFQPAGMNVDLGKAMSGIQGLDTGFSLRDGLRFELGLATKTPDIAHELAQQISAQLQTALASRLDAQQGADLIRKLEIGSEGSRIGIKIALTKEEVSRAMQIMEAARRNAAPGTAATPGDGPKTIRILGLDDGVKEIPLDPKPKN